jgi:hypothetical protein
MNTSPASSRTRSRGYALLFVIILGSASLLIFAGIAKWTSSSSTVNERHNAYNRALAAAEGATEASLSAMMRDFVNQTYDPSSLSAYRALTPAGDLASLYQFSDGSGNAGRTWVDSSSTMVLTNLDSTYKGLYGLVYTCRLRSNAQATDGLYDVSAAVRQDVQLASIPVFQFAIFYSMDLEVNPGPAMTITGKVHSNASLFSSPGNSLDFMEAVSAVGSINNFRNTNDPNGNSGINPVYHVTPIPGVGSLTLPVGTNTTPAAAQAILNIPPSSEDYLSEAGQQRYYNKCDLIITTTNGSITVMAGRWAGMTNLAPDIPASGTNPATYSFLNTNVSFYDGREGKWTVTTEIDVAKLSTWMTNAGATLNNSMQLIKSRSINSVYVTDQRKASGKMPAVRVTGGQNLPASGLTVATPQPLYVKGNFNAPDLTVGSTNTVNAKAASLLGDAITVLSGKWSDSASTNSLASRAATNTTVNAAFLAGIVPSATVSGTKHYSGGVENYPRFLEDWSSKTLTYNGSMVVLFPSRYATNWWITPGTYYQAPTRKWAFDVNFLSASRLPPGTPQVLKLVRSQWSVVAANSAN